MEGGVVEVTWRQGRGREGEGHADERGMSGGWMYGRGWMDGLRGAWREAWREVGR